MKLFTVMEKAVKGIRPKDVDGLLEIGEGLGKALASRPDALLLTGHLITGREYTKPKVVNERHPNDRVALILVATEPGIGGALWLTSNCMAESVEYGRVVRKARPLSEAAGVQILGGQENVVLLGVMPGGSFRICRDGKLNGAAPELTVLWSGRYNPNAADGGLKVFERKNRTGLL